MIRETLKNICSTDGWSYGGFWGFNDTNSLFLSLNDAYSEEQTGALIENMLLQVHVLGEGLIGQAAVSKKHRWIFSDSCQEIDSFLGSFECCNISQDGYELYCQFSIGIKTIALIPIDDWGVVQLGSTSKIPQKEDFIVKVKQLFKGRMEKIDLSLEYEACNSDDQFSYNSHTTYGNLFSSCGNQYFSEAQQSTVLPFSSTSGSSQIEINDKPITPPMEHLIGDFIDSSSWHHLAAYESINEPSIQNSTYLPTLTSAGLLTLEELFQENDYTQLTTLLNNELSYVTGVVPLSLSSTGHCSPTKITENFPTSSMQSSVTDAMKPNAENTFSDFINNKNWNESLIPVCIDESEKSKVGNSNSLFSQLGIDQMLNGTSSSSSCTIVRPVSFDDQSFSAAEKGKTDNYSNHPSATKIDGKMNSPLNHVPDPDKSNISNESKETDSHKEPSKSVKIKSRTGVKPRPKDRQMIQDRLAELRDLIPNGDKMSIDRLLERTIRHIDFMQGLQKHAETLKQCDKPKSRDVQKEISVNGATWACEVGEQSMFCPLIVEDLCTAGQMFIEILCEERGFFLEIADVIRGFGLIILKGVMEVRKEKIWGHFIVEAERNQHVTRHEIFSSLILQMTGQSSHNGDAHFDNVINSGASLYGNSQPGVQFPINLGTLQCGTF